MNTFCPSLQTHVLAGTNTSACSKYSIPSCSRPYFLDDFPLSIPRFCYLIDSALDAQQLKSIVGESVSLHASYPRSIACQMGNISSPSIRAQKRCFAICFAIYRTSNRYKYPSFKPLTYVDIMPATTTNRRKSQSPSELEPLTGGNDCKK